MPKWFDAYKRRFGDKAATDAKKDAPAPPKDGDKKPEMPKRRK